MRHKVLTLLLVLAAGCMPAGEPEPSPSPSVEPSPTPEGRTVQVFWHSGDEQDCGEMVARERIVEEANVRAALEELLAGPTDEEIAEGLGGWFSAETEGMLILAETDGDLVRADFDDLRDVIPNASSSCGSEMLLAQLDSTALQSGASETRYSIEGDPQTFYEWLQMDVPEF